MAEQMTSGEAAPHIPRQYDAYYYRHDCGIPYERNEYWLKFFDDAADRIVRDLHPTSVLDAGCAMGFLVEALRRRGVEAWGVDVSEYAISQVHESIRDYCSVASLTDPLKRHYDLITCIEVVEHIPATQTDAAITNLCGATDQLLLSSSPHDYGEATHLNVQPPEVWSALLAREGFLRDVERDISYLTPWAALYLRADEGLVETVRRYDRSWWRLRHEISKVRGALLKAQEQLAALEERDGIEDRSALLQELDQRNEEVLRLRDLLIGKDAELGATQGQLAVAEDHTQRFSNAAGRIQSRIPGTMRLIGAVLRKLQRRQV